MAREFTKTYTLTLTAHQLGGLKQWLEWMPHESHPSDLRLREALLAQIAAAKKPAGQTHHTAKAGARVKDS